MNSELKNITIAVIGPLIAYVAMLAHIICALLYIKYKNDEAKLYLDSQSSEEINNWHIQRRGDFNRKTKNHIKSDKKDKKPRTNKHVPNRDKNQNNRHKARTNYFHSQSDTTEKPPDPPVSPEPQSWYSKIRTSVKTISYLHEIRTWMSSVTSLQLPTRHVAHFLSHITAIRQSDLFEKSETLFGMLVTIGFLQVSEFSFRGVRLFTDPKLRRPVSLLEIFDASWELISLFCSRFLIFCETLDLRSFYTDTLHDVLATEYTFLATQFIMIEAGREPQDRVHPSNPDSETFPVSFQEYDRRLDEFATTLNLKLASCKDNEKGMYTQKLKEIKCIITKRQLAARTPSRIRPFSFLLFGGSGVAKSSIITTIMRTLLKMNNFDSSTKSIITLNESDKFQSEYRSSHSGVIFDDLCNSKSDKTATNPLDKVIQFINNIPIAALNPNADLKGVLMIIPKILGATTNIKDLEAFLWSNEALAILRRFDFTITQTIKKEYQKKSGMLDPDLVEHMLEDPYPDFALFTVEIPSYVESSQTQKLNLASKKAPTQAIQYDAVEYKGKKLIDISLAELIAFLGVASKKHYAQQKKFVDMQNNAKEIILCEECNMPVQLCNCEKKLDSQSAISNIMNLIPDALLTIETIAVNWFEHHFLAFCLTVPSLILLLIMNRSEFFTLMYSEYCLHGVAVIVALIVDVFKRVPQIYFFAMYSYIAYSMYKTTRAFAIVKATEYARLRRPSEIWVDWGTQFRINIIVGLLALFGAAITTATVTYFAELKIPEASDAIKMKVENPLAKKAYAFWDTQFRNDKYIWNANTTHTSDTMTFEQAKAIMSKRQWNVNLHTGPLTSVTCNAVPIRSGVLLIPNHIVPALKTDVTILRPDRTQKEVISKSMTYNIPGTDFALWYVPTIGDQKDLTFFFADVLAEKQIEFELLHCNQTTGEVDNLGLLSAKSHYTKTTRGGNFDSYVYHFPQGTFNGLCMATALTRTKTGAPFISGFHLAGKNFEGAIGALSRNQLTSGLAQLEKVPGRIITHRLTSLETDIAGINIGVKPEIYEKHPIAHLEKDANLTIFGSHAMPVGRFKRSKVEVSLISPHVTEVMGVERLHGKATGLDAIVHRVNDLERKTNTAVDFDDECFTKAVIDFQTKLISGLSKKDLKEIGKIPDEVNLAGLDGKQGVNRIALRTSMGFPFRGTKERYIQDSLVEVDGITAPLEAEEWIWDEVEYREKILRNGDRSNMISKASMKDESVKFTKDKRRVFTGSNAIDTLLVRKYYLAVSALMQEHKELFECAVGVNVHSPEFTKLMDYVSHFGVDRIVAGDYKAFDGQMSQKFMLAAFRILIDIMTKSGNFDEEDVQVLKGIATEISSPTVDYFGVLVRFTGSNPSGHPLTVVINSLVNSLYIRYAYYVIAKEDKWMRTPVFHTVCKLITYGDDNEMGVKRGYDQFNHTRISSVLAKSDIIYTMADKEAKSIPFINLKDASFLKHYPEWNEDIEMYGARIEEDSIAKMLHTHMESDALSPQQQSCEALQNVARAWFGFGRKYYEANIGKLYEVADRAELRGLLGDLKTYDERVTQFKIDFDLEKEVEAPPLNSQDWILREDGDWNYIEDIEAAMLDKTLLDAPEPPIPDDQWKFKPDKIDIAELDAFTDRQHKYDLQEELAGKKLFPRDPETGLVIEQSAMQKVFTAAKQMAKFYVGMTVTQVAVWLAINISEGNIDVNLTKDFFLNIFNPGWKKFDEKCLRMFLVYCNVFNTWINKMPEKRSRDFVPPYCKPTEAPSRRKTKARDQNVDSGWADNSEPEPVTVETVDESETE
jgi:hypothetical protein